MRSNKFLSAWIIVLGLAASMCAGDLWNSDSTNLFGLPAAYAVTGPSHASISGRIKTPEGKPIKAALIELKDADSNQVVSSTFSSNFGYYRLEQIETGKSYVLSVSHKHYLFVFPAQLLEVNDDQTGVDFTGEKTKQKDS